MTKSMRLSFTADQAKTHFPELLRQVRAGRTVTISYHGKPVAEIRPLESPPRTDWNPALQNWKAEDC